MELHLLLVNNGFHFGMLIADNFEQIVSQNFRARDLALIRATLQLHFSVCVQQEEDMTHVI